MLIEFLSDLPLLDIFKGYGDCLYAFGSVTVESNDNERIVL